MMVISRSETVLTLRGKAGEIVITRVTAPRKGRAALVRVTKEAKKEKLKARMLVSGQHSFEPSISASACFLFLADNLCNLFGLSLCLDM